jgi:hypothetical protein
LDIGGIEWKVELVQETKHETKKDETQLAAQEDPNGFDIYTGPPPLELAHVSTQAFGGGGIGKKHHRPRLPRFKRH